LLNKFWGTHVLPRYAQQTLNVCGVRDEHEVLHCPDLYYQTFLSQASIDFSMGTFDPRPSRLEFDYVGRNICACLQYLKWVGWAGQCGIWYIVYYVHIRIMNRSCRLPSLLRTLEAGTWARERKQVI
jgi:hypothetical protein